MSYEEAADYVEQIMADLLDRDEVGDAMASVSTELQDEIRERWIKILMEG